MNVRGKTATRALTIGLAAMLGACALAGCASSTASSQSASGEAVSASVDASASSDEDKATGVSLISSGSASSSASSASSTSSASSSASSGSSSTVANGTLTDYTNKDRGYTFKYDKAYTVEEKGSDVTVYTGTKSGQAPFFKLTLIQNKSGQTIDEYLQGMADKAVERLGDRIVAGPEFATVKHTGRNVSGYEYAYKSTDGKQTLISMNYAEEISGYLFTWSGASYLEDDETPVALSTAIDTLAFMAS